MSQISLPATRNRFRADIAQATGLAQSVTIDNTAANPVPVREQGVVRIRPAAPVTGGGRAVSTPAGTTVPLNPPATATALAIHMDPDTSWTELRSEDSTAALFYGPAFGGDANVVLSLTRPVTFDEVTCSHGGVRCAVSWVGSLP